MECACKQHINNESLQPFKEVLSVQAVLWDGKMPEMILVWGYHSMHFIALMEPQVEFRK